MSDDRDETQLDKASEDLLANEASEDLDADTSDVVGGSLLASGVADGKHYPDAKLIV